MGGKRHRRYYARGGRNRPFSRRHTAYAIARLGLVTGQPVADLLEMEPYMINALLVAHNHMVKEQQKRHKK